MVQASLNIIGTRYPIIQNLVVDGIFGNNTHNAVVMFQRVFGLAPDGIVGPITWDRIMLERSKIGGGATPFNPGLYLLEDASRAVADSYGALTPYSKGGALTVNNTGLNPNIALLLTLLLIRGILWNNAAITVWQ